MNIYNILILFFYTNQLRNIYIEFLHKAAYKNLEDIYLPSSMEEYDMEFLE